VEIRHHSYLDKYHHQEIVHKPREFWYNEPIYTGYRRCFGTLYKIDTEWHNWIEFTKIVIENNGAEYFVVISNNDTINGHPDMTKAENWRIIKIPDLINPEYKFETRRNVIFAVFFSDVNIPIIRRAIEGNPNWYDDEIYNEQIDIKEMEFN
jgi:hypothetical protein